MILPFVWANSAEACERGAEQCRLGREELFGE